MSKVNTGFLVVNGFLVNEKFVELYQIFKASALKAGVELEVITNSELQLLLGGNKRALCKPDFILFWDKDVYLAVLLEKLGFRVFNSAKAIDICDDKAKTYLELMSNGVRMPQTIVAPKTFPVCGYNSTDFVKDACVQLGLPVVIKECFGSFGQQVYLAHTVEEAEKIVSFLDNKPFIFQEFVSTSVGRDIRINVVGGKIVAAMKRFNETDFRSNVTLGGKMEAVEPTDAQKEMAQKACAILNLDFAGVDILFGENETPLLCEVNSNPHFKSILTCTGINIAEAIINHIKESVD